MGLQRLDGGGDPAGNTKLKGREQHKTEHSLNCQ